MISHNFIILFHYLKNSWQTNTYFFLRKPTMSQGFILKVKSWCSLSISKQSRLTHKPTQAQMLFDEQILLKSDSIRKHHGPKFSNLLLDLYCLLLLLLICLSCFQMMGRGASIQRCYIQILKSINACSFIYTSTISLIYIRFWLEEKLCILKIASNMTDYWITSWITF